MKKLFLTLLSVLTAFTVPAASLDYSYNFNGAPADGYGTAKAETYDVAIHLTNPSFTGAKVTGIHVALPSDGITDASAWLSTALQLKKVNGRNVNNPDIASVAGTAADGWLDITFDTPYTIPAEGVYVGYSFRVSTLQGTTEKPVTVAEGVNPEGFYLHTSRTKLRWGSMSEELGKVSDMTVKLEGTFPEKSAVFTVGNVISEVSEPTEVSLQLVNCGTTAISSVEYTASVNDHTFSGTATPESPVPALIGASGYATLKIDPVDATGEFPLKIKITKINGTAVESPESEGVIKVYPFLPVNRPLIEEYTGLWCGWCPQGYVALETMKGREGDLFIAVAYHNGDEMAFSAKTPNSPGGYPAMYVNRVTSLSIPDIYTDWEKFRTWIPDAGVDVAVDWTDESHTALKAVATARFTESHAGADYRLSYILIADGLSNPTWLQNNSFSGRIDKKDIMPGALGDIFINGNSYVEGLTFNDVAVATTDYDGELNSIPSEIKAGEEYSHPHVFDLKGISEKVLSVPEKLRVIAILTDGRSGKFVNCNSSTWINGDPFTSSVETISPDQEPVETGRWTLDGRRIDSPVEGINIVRYSDGSSRKVFVK